MQKTETMIKDGYDTIPQVAIHEREAPGFEARIALSLVERWGLVAAEIDGEDSAGRAKIRRMTPDELVDQACDTAEKLAAEFGKRGWMIQLPSVAEHVAAKKAEQEKKDEERRAARAS